MTIAVHDVAEGPVLVAMLVTAGAVTVWRLRRGTRFTWPPRQVAARDGQTHG